MKQAFPFLNAKLPLTAPMKIIGSELPFEYKVRPLLKKLEVSSPFEYKVRPLIIRQKSSSVAMQRELKNTRPRGRSQTPTASTSRSNTPSRTGLRNCTAHDRPRSCTSSRSSSRITSRVRARSSTPVKCSPNSSRSASARNQSRERISSRYSSESRCCDEKKGGDAPISRTENDLLRMIEEDPNFYKQMKKLVDAKERKLPPLPPRPRRPPLPNEI